MGVWIEIVSGTRTYPCGIVTPLVGVWIEICIISDIASWISHVTPLVGVWIEIFKGKNRTIISIVTPLVGVWIEIPPKTEKTSAKAVTPLVGVWIEI